MIRFACTCGKAIEVHEMFAGKRVKCPACGEAREVPAASAPEPPPAAAVAAATPAPPKPAPSPPTSSPGLRLRGSTGGDPPPARVHLHLPFTSLSGACLVVAFFLPWMRFSCQDTVLSEPSGYNLATNTEDATMKDLAKSTRDAMRSRSELLPDAPAPGEKTADARASPWGNTTPELWFFPFLGASLAAWGLHRMRVGSGNLRREAVRIVMLSILAGTMLFIERHRSYRKKTILDANVAWAEQQQKERDRVRSLLISDKEEDEFERELGKRFKVEESTGFWLTLISLGGAAMSCGAWLAFGGRPDG